MIPTALFVLYITFFIPPATIAQITRTAFPQTAAWDTVKPKHSSVPCWYIHQVLLTTFITAQMLSTSQQSPPFFSAYLILQTEHPSSSMTYSIHRRIIHWLINKRLSKSLIFLNTCHNIACICKITRVNSSFLYFLYNSLTLLKKNKQQQQKHSLSLASLSFLFSP